jgi:hypothetical protein
MIEKIRRCFRDNRVRYSKHAIFEMEHEELGEILDREIEEAILNGEEISHYPEDTPLPSCLILGKTRNRRPIHVVCAHDEIHDEALVITVYEPASEQWINFRERIR